METPETIKLLGGRLCLDFANSVDWHDVGDPLTATDALAEPDSLERWARRLRLDEPGAEPLPRADKPAAAGVAAPAGGDAVAPGDVAEGDAAAGDAAPALPPELVAARELRAALYALFAAVAAGEPAPPGALERLRDVHAEGAAVARLDRRDGGYALAWPADEPRRVGYAVAADAVTLLADPAALARLKRCPGRDCGWLFLDTSGRRRWCSMGTCGSREKMRRMYARRRAEA
jgi:predicted RNA-binding Zn ribbon-like protein